MASRAIYVEIYINASLERVWELTQNAQKHPRWDIRFSKIIPTEPDADGSQKFVYERGLGVHTIRGTGISMGESGHAGHTRTSALRFTTADRLSPLREGRGYWRYVPNGGGVTFITGYDYEPGWGALIDRLVMRRMIGWMTAWSFDRLRIWAESDVEPERWPLWSVLYVWRRDRPLAKRTLRAREGGAVMESAPASLGRLGAP